MKKYIVIIILIVLTGISCEAQLQQGSQKAVGQTDFTPVSNEPGEPITVQKGAFTIAGLPDTQFYVAKMKGGTPNMFKSQIKWIKNNQKAENIVYVAHLGDLTQNGDTALNEWEWAKKIMYGLENPVSIPYGIAVGNHDQFPRRRPVTGTTNNYNKYFGVEHFEGRPYYGGHYGNNNDSHYDLFTAGDTDFIVVYVEFDSFDEDRTNRNQWMHDVLEDYSSRKAIIVSHNIIGNNETAGTNDGEAAKFSEQGQSIYESVKDCPNVFMMICGHVGQNGEGYRADTYNGNTIHTFLSDYQGRENGGHGMMRLYRISIEKNELQVKTFSPWTNTYETDNDSQFSVRLFN